MTRRTTTRAALGGLLALLIGGAPGWALGQEADPVKARLEKSPRHHEYVEIKTEAGRTVRAFVVFPEIDQPTTAVVVIHENRGLTDFERGVADQLA